MSKPAEKEEKVKDGKALTVKIKMLSPDDELLPEGPIYSEVRKTEGLLLKSPSNFTLKPGDVETIALKVCVKPPEGCVVFFEPAMHLQNKGFMLGSGIYASVNSEEEVHVLGVNTGGGELDIKKGETISAMYLCAAKAEDFLNEVKQKATECSWEAFTEMMDMYKRLTLNRDKKN